MRRDTARGRIVFARQGLLEYKPRHSAHLGTIPMLDSAQQRANMVATQLRTNDVTDSRLIKAILSVPREDFVPAALVPLAYMEGCLPLGKGRVLLDLRSFGKMAQLAAIGPSDRVLDVGCGTGYSTAVLAHLAAHVTGLDQEREFADFASANLQGRRQRGHRVFQAQRRIAGQSAVRCDLSQWRGRAYAPRLDRAARRRRTNSCASCRRARRVTRGSF